MANIPDPTGPAVQIVTKAVETGFQVKDLAAAPFDLWRAELAWFSQRHNWTRVAWGVLGVGFVFGGLSIMFRRPVVAGVEAGAKVVTGVGKLL